MQKKIECTVQEVVRCLIRTKLFYAWKATPIVEGCFVVVAVVVVIFLKGYTSTCAKLKWLDEHFDLIL